MMPRDGQAHDPAATPLDAALRANRELLRAITANVSVVLFALNRDGVFILAEGGGLTRLGRPPEEAVGRSVFDLYRDVPEVLENSRRALAGEEFTATVTVQGFVFETHYTPLRDARGGVDGVIGVAVDVTERARVEQALRESEQRLRTVISNAPLILFALDADGTFMLGEGRGLAALGLRPNEWAGRSVFDVYAGQPEILADVRRALAGEAFNSINSVAGLVYETHWSPLYDAHGEVSRVIGVAVDITKRAQAEDAARRLALHDTLTDLPNRLLLFDRLGQALLTAQRKEHSLALLLLDLNHFKDVNDTFGHHHGDLLLTQVGRRLMEVLRASDTVARLGGDEFAVILMGDGHEGAVQTARKLHAALDAPFEVEGRTLHVGGSIGIALYPEHGADAGILLRHADIAMYGAKRLRSGYALYAPEQNRYTPMRHALLASLRQGLDQHEFVLHYQPQVEPASGRVRGVEALARWQHPGHGLVMPEQFIPLAEQTGLIAALTHLVLDDAVRQACAWQRAGLVLAVAVNLSMWNVYDPRFPDDVAALLQTNGVAPGLLTLELTESTMMADATRTREVLAGLHELGVHLAIDDYGTGYSSLAYLKRLPVDEIKIDKMFVREMAADTMDAAIVASTVGLGHSLGLQVVAEGVEQKETWDRLASMHCDAAQGYYLSRPLPVEEATRWLLERAIRP